MITPVKFYRMTKEMKAKDLAVMAGISVSLLSKIECGRVGCSPRVKAKIAEALNISESVLFGAI